MTTLLVDTLRTYSSAGRASRQVVLRVALAAGFVSAVADRLGLWGAPGASGVAWGAWDPFVAYTGLLNPWVPPILLAPLAALVTALEVILAALLLSGRRMPMTATATAALLCAFAVAMAVVLGPKAPLDYSVLTAAAAAWVLAENPNNTKQTP